MPSTCSTSIIQVASLELIHDIVDANLEKNHKQTLMVTLVSETLH